jgi:16S rRNA (cytosine1402-N4)-methyltransferase
LGEDEMFDRKFHQPVLVDVALKFLIKDKHGIYVDCTLGGGGHSSKILENLSPEGFLIGIDADAEAIDFANNILQDSENKFLKQCYYDQLDGVLIESGRYPVDGILYDLGISSHQVDQNRRGFSFQSDAPLNMRFDQSHGTTAADILNNYSIEELGKVFREYGEEPRWKVIVRNLEKYRMNNKFETTQQLAEIVINLVNPKLVNKSLARVFQALRIEVNNELDGLKKSLNHAFNYLMQGGRLVIISYHSLEDRIVKEYFRYKASECVCPPELPQCVCDKLSELKILTKKIITPTSSEIESNNRARSAKLRAAEKLIPFEPQ